MKTKLVHMVKASFCLLFLICVNMGAKGACNEYIQQLNNGDIKFSVTFPVQKAYVEVFARKNGVQHLATNIVGSQVNNPGGTYTYSYVMPASFYSTGDVILTRFYSYSAGGPGIFTPAPSEGVWSQPFIYNQTTCDDVVTCNTYIKQLPDGSIKLTVTFPTARGYVEVFASKNDVQHLAVNIVGSQVNNPDGTFTYSYILPASFYATGDKIRTRFYSYAPGGPGVFTPGPSEGVWSEPFFYNETCQKSIYVSASTGNNANPGTKSSPVKTIAKGIALAQATASNNVKVAMGTYIEGNLNVVNGINVFGGYSANFNTRDISRVVNVTTIDANQPDGFWICGSARIFRIENITLPTVIEGFVMKKGRLCAYGGGVYVRNSSDKLIIRNNSIKENSSVGSGTSGGGNMYLENSAPKIHNNQIINGFSGGGSPGSDLLISGTYTGGTKSEIYNNLFTTPSSVSGVVFADFYSNTYLSMPRLDTRNNDHSDEFNSTGNDFSVSPNPSEGIVNMNFVDIQNSASVKVYSTTGAIVYEGSVNAPSLNIDLSKENKGMYFIRVQNQKSVTTKRLILK